MEFRWNNKTNRVLCAIDTFLKDELKDKIGLKDSKSCINTQKQGIEKNN